MNPTQVRYVLSVAAHRNFSRAAEHLYLSQPALSLQVSRVEEELGCPLFVRTKRGVLLTDSGAEFVRLAKPAMQSWEQFQERLEQFGKQPAGRLRLGLGARVYSNDLLPPLLHFCEKYPDIETTFISDMDKNMLEELEEGRLDAALDRLPPEAIIQHPQLFTHRELIRERQCVLLSPDDARSGCASISFEELEGCTVVTGPENSVESSILQQDCRDFHIRFRKIYRCDSISTSMDLIRSGAGVAIGPESFRDYYRLAAVPMLPETYISLSFICLTRTVKEPKLLRLKTFLEGLALRC